MNHVSASASPALDFDGPRERQRDIFFSGLLVYTIMFYSQFAARLPFLAPLRLELVLGSFLVLAAVGRIFSGRVAFRENRLNLAALLFIAAAFLTVPFALVKSRALNTFIDLLKFSSIYLMIVVSVTTEKQLRTFLLAYLAMITLLFLEPFILSLFGKGFIYNNHMLRLAGITGYFQHPNQLGGITAENIAFLYYMMRYEKSKTGKFICLMLILISVRVVMLTQSRTGFLGVISVFFFIWLLSERKLRSFGIILCCAVVAWQFAPQQTKDRFMTLARVNEVLTLQELGEEVHQELGSMQSRQELIRRGLIAFKENPIVGVGLKCFISFNGQRWGYWFPPHNTYIQALAEMGIIGFSAFAFVIYITIKNIRTARDYLRRAGSTDSFLWMLTSALLVYLFARLVVSFFGQDLYANYWWVAGGLSLVLLRIVKAKYQDSAVQDTRSEVATIPASDTGSMKSFVNR